MTHIRNSFFIWNPAQPPLKPTLFCLPFAGGSAAYFVPWRNEVASRIDVVPVQLPGRGNRIAEPPYQDIGELVGALSEALTPYADRPYALFGHSMGAAVSIALAHELTRRGVNLPMHLFVSGRRAPHLPARRPSMHLLDDAALVAELRVLEGTPETILADAELLGLMLPTIRADLKVVETAGPIPEIPISIPITVFGGEDDRVSRQDLAEWQRHTCAGFAMTMYPGGHFFLQAARPSMLRIIEAALSGSAR